MGAMGACDGRQPSLHGMTMGWDGATHNVGERPHGRARPQSCRCAGRRTASCAPGLEPGAARGRGRGARCAAGPQRSRLDASGAPHPAFRKPQGPRAGAKPRLANSTEGQRPAPLRGRLWAGRPAVGWPRSGRRAAADTTSPPVTPSPFHSPPPLGPAPHRASGSRGLQTPPPALARAARRGRTVESAAGGARAAPGASPRPSPAGSVLLGNAESVSVVLPARLPWESPPDPPTL
jgi:hypothetical protein